MRIKIDGAVLTDGVIRSIRELQADNGTAELFLTTIDRLTKSIPLSEDIFKTDAEVLQAIRALELMRQTIETLSMVDDQERKKQ